MSTAKTLVAVGRLFVLNLTHRIVHFDNDYYQRAKVTSQPAGRANRDPEDRALVGAGCVRPADSGRMDA